MGLKYTCIMGIIDHHIFTQVNSEYEVLITIETVEIYAGDLPTRKQKLVLDWVSGNSDWLLDLFYELNPELL